MGEGSGIPKEYEEIVKGSRQSGKKAGVREGGYWIAKKIGQENQEPETGDTGNTERKPLLRVVGNGEQRMRKEETEYRGLLGRSIMGEKLSDKEEEKLSELSKEFKKRVGVEKEGDVMDYEFRSREEADLALMELQNEATDRAREAAETGDNSKMIPRREFQRRFKAVARAKEKVEKEAA